MNNKVIQTCCNEGFDEKEAYGAYKIFFGTLVSGSRLKIINLLRQKSMNVGEIVKSLKIDQTHVSHDLARLRECGFVNTKMDKKYKYYSLNEQTIEPIMNLIDKHMAGNCIHILRAKTGRASNSLRKTK